VTCTVDRGYSVRKVENIFDLTVFDEDDNAPTSQIDEYFWNWSELKEVSFVFLVDFLILCFGINQQTNYVAMSNEGGMLKGLATVSYFYTDRPILSFNYEEKRWLYAQIVSVRPPFL